MNISIYTYEEALQLSGKMYEYLGGKIRNQLFLYKNGFSIPKGWILLFESKLTNDCSLSDWLENLPTGNYIARSSAPDEDGMRSFAGIHDSIFFDKRDNETEVAIEAIKGVIDSYYSEKANQYRARIDQPMEKGGFLAVLVQERIKPEKSGILYTFNPITSMKEMMIEAVPGSNEKLTDGRQSPDLILYKDGIVTIKRIRSGSKKECLRRREIMMLVSLGEKLEYLLSAPQDIEWAISDQKLIVLQARPLKI